MALWKVCASEANWDAARRVSLSLHSAQTSKHGAPVAWEGRKAFRSPGIGLFTEQLLLFQYKLLHVSWSDSLLFTIWNDSLLSL